MASEEDQMAAMMQQMQAMGGGGNSAPPKANNRHHKAASNMSLSIIDLQSKQAQIDPMIEIQDYHAEKELLLKAYDDIDLDDNGDIEWDEFEQGMERLRVSLTDAEVKQVFKLMDSDSSNFVDRNEFTMFLSQRFESTELTRFQDAILRKIGGRSRKSGVLSGDNADGMGDIAIAAMEREMRKEMNTFVDQEMVILKEEEKLYQDLEKQEEEQQDFGAIERAKEWNRFEVAHWIDVEVKLSEYMTSFMKAHVDGSILLSDLSEGFLVNELAIKRVHVSKIMRAIVELRDKIRTEWDESDAWDIISYPNQYMNDERSTDKITFLEGEITRKDKEMEELKQEYESRIQKLIGQISEKEEIIKQAEQDGFILDNGDGTDTGSDYDSADVTDDDMPPLIDAHQQTLNYFANENGTGVRTSHIHEREEKSENNITDEAVMEEKKEDVSNEEEVVSNEEEVMSTNSNNSSANASANASAQATPKVDSTLAPIDRIVSASPTPALTPSASQQMLTQTQSASHTPRIHARRRKKHHRKNSTKTGFWADNKLKKKPPAGTKAYWLYLDQKAAMNANFCSPLRVVHWHHHEIAYWLKQIKCDKYAVKFVEEKVSGEQMIFDMNSSVLSADLGVKMLHCGKIMREIESLKIQAGITFSVEEKVTSMSYRPSNEESVTKQLEAYEQKMSDIQEKHEEELKEKDGKYEELQTETEKVKGEVEGLEKQVVELEKRKAKKSDYDDSDSESEEEEETVVNTVVNTAVATDEVKDANESENKTEIQTVVTTVDSEKLQKVHASGKRPKGYFRKYPKEIRKLMREIDGMERKSNDGTYGQSNIGKFAAMNRAFKWKTHEVCAWLEKKGFVSYIHSFYQNGIDGEILVNDLNPVILHEDLSVKRFHTGKMLREIQVLRQGGQYTECMEVIDIAYAVQFSASGELEKLRTENQDFSDKLAEGESKIEELINRPQIEEHQKIVEIADWDELVSEKTRLAAQVDEYEEKIDDIKHNAVPQQEAAEKKHKLLAFMSELDTLKEKDSAFGDVIRVRQWNVMEVCWFFKSIGLGDYAHGIKEQKINGEILIEDTSAELLSRDIGVKRIHINQVLRQVSDLKHKAFGYEEESEVCDIGYTPEVFATELNESYEKKIEGLENDIKAQETQYSELNDSFAALNTEKEGLITDKNGLLSQIETLNGNVTDLKAAQQLEMEENAQNTIQELQLQIEGLNKSIADNETLNSEQKQTTENESNAILEEKEGIISECNTKIEGLESKLNEASVKIEEFLDKERIAREEEEAKDNSYQAQLRRNARDDHTFCVPKRAHKWTIEEVSHWLYTLKVGEYVDTFKEQLVDGSMLLSDLSPEQLRTDLAIKQYHIGKITREIAKLEELATPPLGESEIVCDNAYIPERNANEYIGELKHELNEQKDINTALNMEVQNLKDQYETIKEIQAMNSEMQLQETKGGPHSEEKDSEELAQSGSGNNNTGQSGVSVSSEEMEKLTKENSELNEMLDYLAKSKMDLAMRTADEMQHLRDMVRVASQAYEELAGTPLGKMANWPGTQRFFYDTLGMTPNGNKNNRNDKYRR